MNIFLQSLGCRLNEAELESWADGFSARGHSIRQNPDDADLVVINTCAVTDEAAKKSRQLIRRSQRQNPYAKLVVSGCYATLAPGLPQRIPGIDLLVPNEDKDRLPALVESQIVETAMPDTATGPGTSALFARGRNRAFIKIQDGCRYRCTFCIVTVARGSERSVTPDTVIEQINSISQQGIKEVVLTGVHVGGYGSDIQSSLFILVEAILAETDIPRVRLASVEPWDLPENFFTLFDNPRLMPHLHLPLQSGSDVVLKAMARRCRTLDYAALLHRARSQVPDMNITTDIIVGFPGETDEEWQNGLQFLREMAFSHMHIFPYSTRAGTHAATLPGQLQLKVKKQRCRELHRVMRTMKHEALQAQVGQRVPVLVETMREDDEALVASGYSPAYHRVEFMPSATDDETNHIRDVRITGLAPCNQALTGVPA